MFTWKQKMAVVADHNYGHCRVGDTDSFVRDLFEGVDDKDSFAFSPLAKIEDPLRKDAAGGAHPRRI